MSSLDPPTKKSRISPLLFDEILEVIKNDNIDQLLTWLDDSSIRNVNMKSGPDLAYSSLLIMASEIGKISSVRLLLKYGASINQENSDLNTPVAVACHAGHLDIVKLLHSRGADLDDEYILLATCQSGHIEVVRYLLDHGADINSERGDRGTPLTTACYHGYLEIAKLLIECGADINFVYNDRYEDVIWNPLAAACFGNHLEIVKYLVSIGADVILGAPLTAIFANNIELISYLLDNGADIHAFSPYSNPLLRASGSGLVENAKLLLERGASVHVHNTAHSQATSLIYACMLPYRRAFVHPTIKLLLDYGADTNDVDSEGDSALIHLLSTSLPDTAEGDLECVRLLLQYGADVTLTNLAGQTASSLVERGSAICNLLAEYRDINDRELLAVKPLVK